MLKANKWTYMAVVLVFFVYAAWLIGPYLRSALVRDAAVTTWSRAAVAPIAGKIVSSLPQVGSIVGPDGMVATIRNDLLLAEQSDVEDTRDRVVLAELQIKEAREHLARIEELDRARLESRALQAEIFHAQLEAEIANIRREIAANGEHIEVLQRIVDRKQSLVERGTGSSAALDEELLRLAEMKSRQIRLEADLKVAQLRDGAAEDGVYSTQDGETPAWVRLGELDLQLAANRARQELHTAETTLEEARKDLAAQQGIVDTLSQSEVTAPPGSLVFSVVVPPDATLSAGDRIIEWIDCTLLLVDVPVSDAELPLIEPGTPAGVVLEGEARVRDATVLLTRGSAATLTHADLAAIAKGRAQGIAQVLLTLDAARADFDECPVGWAAYVEFPDVGLIDVLRARLRL